MTDALNYPICPGFALADKSGSGTSMLTQKSSLIKKSQDIIDKLRQYKSSSKPSDVLREMNGQHKSPPSPPRRKAYRDNSNEPGFDYEPCTESYVVGEMKYPLMLIMM